MKVVLYMATTANGYIAKENGETPWSKEEWLSFSTFVKKVKNMVVGRNTYEIMVRGKEFKHLGNPFIVVVSNKSIPKINVAHSPREALKILKNKGFTTALVAGGGKLNASFLKEKLVDKIYLDVEPLIFGKGIRLFAEDDFEVELELMETKKISKNTLQLHYKVRK